MKEGIGTRLRDRLRPVPDPKDRDNRPRDGMERSVIEEAATEFTAEELREFLEADLYPVQADPAFKEELREKLWTLVQSQAVARTKDEETD